MGVVDLHLQHHRQLLLQMLKDLHRMPNQYFIDRVLEMIEVMMTM